MLLKTTEVIKNCQQELDLSHRQFEHLSEFDLDEILLAIRERAMKENSFDYPRLKSINLSHCKIAASYQRGYFQNMIRILPSLLEGFSHFQHLQSLDLSNGTLKSFGACFHTDEAKYILAELEKLLSLQFLDLSNNPLHEIYETYPKEDQSGDTHYLYMALSKLPLKQLKMQGIDCGRISSSGSQRAVWSRFIETLLAKHPTLELCDLSKSDFMVHTYNKFYEGPISPLNLSPFLKTIILTNATLFNRGPGSSSLGSYIPSHYNCLKYLSLLSADLQIEGTKVPDSFAALLDKLSKTLLEVQRHDIKTHWYPDQDFQIKEDGKYKIENVKTTRVCGVIGFKNLCAVIAFTLYKAAKKFSVLSSEDFAKLTELTLAFFELIPSKKKLAIIQNQPEEDELIKKIIANIPGEELKQWRIANAVPLCIAFLQGYIRQPNETNLLKVLPSEIIMQIIANVLPQGLEAQAVVGLYNDFSSMCENPSNFFKTKKIKDAVILEENKAEHQMQFVG